MAFKLEICAPNLLSVDAAVRSKADRIELCAAIEIGGITPSPAIMRYACRQIETHVMIRPRAGHFLYDHTEFKAMLYDINQAKKAGAKGVVFGILNKKDMPNKYELAKLVDAAGPMECTFHRAFDVCKQHIDAMEVLISLGFKRILTSGGAASAWEGRELLKKLQERAEGRITIMAGGGITPENILEIRRATGCADFHSSAKMRTEVDMVGIDGLDPNFLMADTNKIRSLKMALEYAV